MANFQQYPNSFNIVRKHPIAYVVQMGSTTMRSMEETPDSSYSSQQAAIDTAAAEIMSLTDLERNLRQLW